MAPLRIQTIGGMYHVNGKAVDGAKLFRDDVDRGSFLNLLCDQAERSNWCILGYSLMTTHYHLILKLRELTLSSGFQRLNSIYARLYNRRHGRRGALWQRRFYDEIIEADNHLYEAIRYVALNASRANACRSPEDWPWSNYGSAIGVASRDPLVEEAELLRLFDRRPETARRVLKAMVDEVDPRARRRQSRV